MKYLKYIFLLFFTALLTSCVEINSENTKEIFELWTGTELPKDINMINGKYWQSAHWSKEYELYAEIKPTQDWWKKMKKINQLDEFKSQFNIDIEEQFLKNNNKDIIEQPNWFKPEKNSEVYIKGSSEYFWNPKTKTLFIHEIQL